MIKMGIPTSKTHEANFDYLLRKSLEELIEINPKYQGLTVELQPQAKQMGRPDLILRDGLKPLIIFETKKHQEDVDSLAVHRKAREYAMTMKADYFVVSNASRFYFFKNDMGALRELQINSWEVKSRLNVKLILDDILAQSLGNIRQGSRKQNFLQHYERIYNAVVEEYIVIFHDPKSLEKMRIKQKKVKGLLKRAEKEILSYMGVEVNARSFKTREISIKNLASQAAYLLLNKIFCYQVISAQFRKQFDIPLPKIYSPKKVLPFQNQMDRAFDMLMADYDFAPIFNRDSFFSRIPFSSKLETLTKEFLEELAEFNLEDLEEDFIGEMYQRLIPLSRKKALGQIYTPVDIAKLMVELAVVHPDQIILDPACGCGTFLKELYHKLEQLNKMRNSISGVALHEKLLAQIWGVEINSFPAHLSMMNLTFQNLSTFTDLVGVLIHDFLNMGPMEKYIIKTRNLRTGEIISREMPHKFDIIIANPPYVKQEKIPNKKEMLKNLAIFATYRSLPEQEFTRLNLEASPDKLEKTLKLPKVKLNLKGQTDYYGYFLWYSTFLLRNKGVLCFIIPNKWMDVKYGEEVKQFLLDHYRIRAIIAFTKNVFPEAQVSTIILYVSKDRNRERCEDNIVKFLSIGNRDNTNELIQLVKTTVSKSLYQQILIEDYIFHNPSDDLRCTYVLQGSLSPQEKWSFKYLYQSEFIRLLAQVDKISLDGGKITSVVPGMKTGANRFFFPSNEDIDSYLIEAQFLQPGIKSGRQIPEELVINKAPVKFLAVPENTNINDHLGLKNFIQDGKNVHDYHNRPSIKWDPWYHIPPDNRDSPDILFLRHIDKTFIAHWNRCNCIVSDGVRGIKVHDPDHILFYLGVLNSTFFYWQAHIKGRWEGQGDLQLLVYELRSFDIPDISAISPEKRIRVEEAMKSLMKQQRTLIDSDKYQNLSKKNQKTLLTNTLDNKTELDRAVLATLDLEHKYEVLVAETHIFESLRLNKSI